MKLSPNFTLAEMTASQIAERHGIDNAPDEQQIDNLILLCDEILEPLRAAVGPIIVTSGFRCLRLNRKLGSRDTSYHVFGRAADIKVRSMAPLDLCRKIVDMQLPYDELISEYATADGRGWCHVAVALQGTTPRREVKSIDRHGVRRGVLLEAR